MRLSAIALGTLAPAALFGQISPLSSPISGVLFHIPSGSIRQLLGVPGAAYYGPALATADHGFPSPDGQAAIVMTSDTTALLRLTGADGTVTVLGALLPHADQAAWAVDSNSAFLLNSATSELQRVWLVNAGWTASDIIPIPGLPSGATLLAALSSCRCALFSYVDGPAQHFIIIKEDGSLQPVADVDSSAVSSLDSDDVLYTASASQVERVRLSDPAPVLEMVIQDFTLAQPTAVLASHADNTLAIATQDNRISLYDLQQKSPVSVINLSFNASLLRRLGSQGRYYQLNEPVRPFDALYVLALGQINRVFFVPAVEP